MASTPRKYVFEQWNSFRQSEMPPDIPDAYYDALKECFFAGSIAMVRILNNHTDEDLEDVKRELLEFVRGILRATQFDPDSFKLPTM